MKKVALFILVGLGTLSLARPRYRFRSPQGHNRGSSSGSLSGVGASNIDDRKPGKVTHLFPSRPSSRPQNSGSLSGVGASNTDSARNPRSHRP